jgi:hypothetical protein
MNAINGFNHRYALFPNLFFKTENIFGLSNVKLNSGVSQISAAATTWYDYDEFLNS